MSRRRLCAYVALIWISFASAPTVYAYVTGLVDESIQAEGC